MRREWSQIDGVVLASAAVHADERGDFTKLYDGGDDELAATQLCTASNHRRGTVRGLHLQVEPHPETKVLWCTSGELFDVLVDVRPDSPTYGDWAAIHLSARRPALLTVPPMVAHGYQTLADDTAVVYLIRGRFAPDCARTIRWDDPTLAVSWPLEPTVMSANDRAAPLWPVS